MLISKYEYPTLRRETQTNGKRQYVGDDSIPVPSVTTVLSETGDKTALINWRKRVGDEEWDTFGNNHVSVLAKTMTTMMVENGLTKIDELWGVEVALIAKGLYAGTSDAIGVYEGEDAIIDFKTSKKIKKREWIEDYFMQGCAYALAHNEMMGTEIRKVVILMVDREGKFAEFTIKGEEFDEYCDKWAQRLADYFNK